MATLATALVAADHAWSQTQSVTYDALGRVTSVVTTDGKQTIYTYDAAGNRTVVTTTGTAAKHGPVAGNQAKSYSYGQPPLSFDPRTDPVHDTIVGVTSASLGVASFTATSVTWTPSATPVAGTDQFGFEVTNASGLTASALITVTLINPAPIASPASFTVAENSTTYSFDPNPSHHPFTVTGVTAALHGTSGFTSTTASYQPAPAYWGSDVFSYTIVNGSSPSASGSVSATVTATPPIAGPVSVGTAATNPVTFDPRLYASDPQGLALTVTAAGAPGCGTVMVNGGVSITYSPGGGCAGANGFSFTVTNAGGGSASSTATVTVGAALAAQVDKTTWKWYRFFTSPPNVGSAVNATVSGGQAPYTLAWQWFSGQITPAATAPAWFSTQWMATVPEDGNVYSSLWRLKVTDSLGAVAYSPQVTVTFEWDNNH